MPEIKCDWCTNNVCRSEDDHIITEEGELICLECGERRKGQGKPILTDEQRDELIEVAVEAIWDETVDEEHTKEVLRSLLSNLNAKEIVRYFPGIPEEAYHYVDFDPETGEPWEIPPEVCTECGTEDPGCGWSTFRAHDPMDRTCYHCAPPPYGDGKNLEDKVV